MKQCSMAKELLQGDWRGKTIPEIAQCLHIQEDSVRWSMGYLRRKYGIRIQYQRRKCGRKRKGTLEKEEEKR